MEKQKLNISIPDDDPYFKSCSLSLGHRTLLIGQNGSGKSRFFQRLSMWTGTSVSIFNFDTHTLASASSIDINPYLSSTGEDIANVLDWLRGEVPQAYNAIEQNLQAIFPEILYILLTTTETHKKKIGIQFQDKTKLFGDQVSEGFLMTIALLTIFHSPQKAKICCIENIERYLHPKTLNAIFRHFEKNIESNDAFMLFSTHNYMLLSRFYQNPESIILVTRKQGKIELSPSTTLMQEGEDFVKDTLPKLMLM